MKRIKSFLGKNKIYLGIILIVTIIVVLVTCIQLGVIMKKSPDKDNEYKINYNDQDINMDNVLSYLKNISMENHPVFSEGNVKVMQKITKYLDEFGLQYEVQDNLYVADFDTYYNEYYENTKKVILNNPEINPEHITDLNEFFKWEGVFEDFDAYFLVMMGAVDETEYHSIEEYRSAYEAKNSIDRKINNIIVKIGNFDDNKDSIVLSAHYDSGDEEGNMAAIDNGMNVAALLECARLIKDSKFNNNIYLVFVNAEEEVFLGAKSLVKENILKNVKIVFNFDNMGTGGNLIPWQFSDGGLVEKYLAAVSSKHGYVVSSKLKNILVDWVETDYMIYSNEYPTINFALFTDNSYYHTKNDRFENVNVGSLKQTTKTMYELINYFGNDSNSYDSKDIWYMEIINGVVVKLDSKLYRLLMITILCLSVIYLWYLLYSKNYVSLFINFVFVILSVFILIYLDSIVFIFIIPIILSFISSMIKNKKYKLIYDVVSYTIVISIFSFITIQIMSMLSLGIILFTIPLLYLINSMFNDNRKRIFAQK